MKDIKPSQFIEAILECQQMNSISKVELKVRTFNRMVDQLYELNICIQFGFTDLLGCIELFEDVLLYKDHGIQISCTKDSLNKVKQYNQIYAFTPNFVEINNVWEKLIKLISHENSNT